MESLGVINVSIASHEKNGHLGLLSKTNDFLFGFPCFQFAPTIAPTHGCIHDVALLLRYVPEWGRFVLFILKRKLLLKIGHMCINPASSANFCILRSGIINL